MVFAPHSILELRAELRSPLFFITVAQDSIFSLFSFSTAAFVGGPAGYIQELEDAIFLTV